MSGKEYKELFPGTVIMPPEYCTPTPGMIGCHHSEETKAKLRNRISWWIKEDKPNPAKAPEARAKISEKVSQREWSKKSKTKLSKTMKEKHRLDEEYHEKVISSLLKFNSWEHPEIVGKMKVSMKKSHWSTKHNSFYDVLKIPVEEWLRRTGKGVRVHPNRLEQKIMSLVSPLGYEFQKPVGALLPDFVNDKRKKVIEVFGDYWHGEREGGTSEEERKSQLAECGYECLVIWEHDLENLSESEIVSRIESFSMEEDA